MDEAKFWELIEWSKVESANKKNDDADSQLAVLVGRLETLLPSELRDFDHILNEKMALAYRWDLWAVAYIINGGCSNDSFMDFRAWLISQGKELFENALRSPEAVAEAVQPGEETFYEGFCSMTFDLIPDDVDLREHSEPPEPLGSQWEDQDLPKLFPTACKKFGFEAVPCVAQQMQNPLRLVTRFDRVIAELHYGPWTEECTSFCRKHEVQHLFLNFEGADIAFCELTDIAFLEEIPLLRSLRIHSNQIVDLSPISYLTRLESFSGYLPDLPSVSQLGLALPLRELYLYSCKKLQNIDELSKLPVLKTLSLDKCGTIESLKPLSGSTTLESLVIAETYVADGDLGCLLQIKSLEHFAFSPSKSYSHTTDEWLQAKWGEDWNHWKGRSETLGEAWSNSPNPAVDPPEAKRTFYL